MPGPFQEQSRLDLYACASKPVALDQPLATSTAELVPVTVNTLHSQRATFYNEMGECYVLKIEISRMVWISFAV